MERQTVDHYGATYAGFAADVYAEIRTEAFGEDIGQTGWLTAEEQDLFLSWLELGKGFRLLDVACGAGGPTLRAARLSGCEIHGIDKHPDAVRAAESRIEHTHLTNKAIFQQVDAGARLPHLDASFDRIVCIDAINHLPDRGTVLREWARVLKPGGRLVFTNPTVITGAVSNDELKVRSSIGLFVFVPGGYDEELLAATGFQVIEKKDQTDNVALVARRWFQARQSRADALRRIEGIETFDGQQRFFDMASRLAAERRLSRYAFCAQRAGMIVEIVGSGRQSAGACVSPWHSVE